MILKLLKKNNNRLECTYTAEINYIIYILLLRAIFIYLSLFKREIYFEYEICHAENMEYILTEENKKRIEKKWRQ